MQTPKYHYIYTKFEKYNDFGKYTYFFQKHQKKRDLCHKNYGTVSTYTIVHKGCNALSDKQYRAFLFVGFAWTGLGTVVQYVNIGAWLAVSIIISAVPAEIRIGAVEHQ